MAKQIKKLIIVSSLLVMGCLGACAVEGPLETAPPMWGKAKEDYKAKQAQDAQKAKEETDSKSPKNN